MEVKKNPDKDLTRKRTLFLGVGLLVGLTLLLMAFEARTSPSDVFSQYDFESFLIPDPQILPPLPEEEEDIPITRFAPESPPPPTIVISQNPETRDDWFTCDFAVEPDLEVIDEDLLIPLPDEQVEDPIFFNPVSEAYFPGGNKAWQKYLEKELRYPKSELQKSIEGRIFLSFTIDSLGAISDIEVMRGLTEALNGEAIRVMKASPPWVPAMQRGKPMNSRMHIQFRYKGGM